MRYLGAIVLAALLAVEGAIIFATSRQLPARVATHFDGQGFANGFMTRVDYLWLMTGLGFGLPLLLLLVLVVLPCLMPTRLRIPSRDYWIAPARRQATLNTVATSGLIIACIVSTFMIAMHLLVVQANNRAPPRLDNAQLYTLVALLVIAILVWQTILWRRFRVPR